MKSDNERIEAFLKGVVLPEYESAGHARQLRAQILSRLQTGRAGRGTSSWWKTAALLLGLLGAAALAAEAIIQAHHYHFYGKAKDGSYLIFSTTPENAETNQADSIVTLVRGDLDAAGIEQERKDLEEIDMLRQRNSRELVEVLDSEVNNRPLGRLFFYSYVLADGRTETRTDSGNVSLSPTQMEDDQKQITDLRQRGQRDIIGIIEVEGGGKTQRSLCCRYLLSDLRGVIRVETDPQLPGRVPLTYRQETELARLALEKKGEFLGSTQVQVLGGTFSLQQYSFTLSDGTVVKRSEGQPEGPKNNVTPAYSEEIRQLAAANKGETLGTYAEDVQGKPFKFRRVKYVLSDGTEIIQSRGKPASER